MRNHKHYERVIQTLRKVYIIKLAMKFWYPLNTIEGMRIMIILAIELSPKCRMQDCIYYLVVQSKSLRFVEHLIRKSTKKEL